MYVWLLQTSTGLDHLLPNGLTSIGRDRSICQIYLRGKHIGRLHANIQRDDDKLFLHIWARHPLLLNGRSIIIRADEAVVIIQLKDDDEITIYGETLHLIKYQVTHSDHEDTDSE